MTTTQKAALALVIFGAIIGFLYYRNTRAQAQVASLAGPAASAASQPPITTAKIPALAGSLPRTLFTGTGTPTTLRDASGLGISAIGPRFGIAPLRTMT